MPSSHEKIKQYIEEEMRKKDNTYPEENNLPDLGKKLEDDGFRYEMRHGKRYLVYAPDRMSNIVRRTEEKIYKLKQVSGKSIDELIGLFAAGWTLEPPKEYPSFREFLDSL